MSEPNKFYVIQRGKRKIYTDCISKEEYIKITGNDGTQGSYLMFYIRSSKIYMNIRFYIRKKLHLSI